MSSRVSRIPASARRRRRARGTSRSGRRTACRRAGGGGSGTPPRWSSRPRPSRGKTAARQPEVGVGVEPLRDGVHLLAPGPERPPLPLRPPPQRPVERVAVGVGEAGEGEAGEGRGGFPGSTGETALGGRSIAREVTTRPPGSTRVNRPSSISTSTSSWTAPSTHARSSRYDGASRDAAARGCRRGRRRRPGSRPSSACSAGEWETPVGLRTKSIAVGMPAAARMPASWPAAVGMTGQSPSAWSAAIRAASVGVERHRARHRLRGHRPATCRRGRPAPAPAG